MNNITYAVSVDVNNPIIPYNVYVANVLDSNVRYLEITLYQNGNVITLSNTATATASLVTDNVLVNDSVNCTIQDNIITVPLEDLQRHGNLDVQVTVTEGTKVLAIPFPIQVRVTPNIAENAQIDENSLGSYAEVVHEIAEARGTYTTLHDVITAKLDNADGSVKENNIANESITVEKVADDLAAVINAKAPLSTAYTFDSTTTNVTYDAANPKTIYLNAYINGKNVFVFTTANNYYQIALCYDGTEYMRELTAGGSTTYKPWVLVNNENTGNKKNSITVSNKMSTTLYPSIKAVVDYLVANYLGSGDNTVSWTNLAAAVQTVINGKESFSNKKTTITGYETSNQFYPTTKAVADALSTKAPAATAYTFDSTTTNVEYNANNPKTIYTNAYVNGKNVFVLTTANNYYQIALCYDGTEYKRELTAGGSTTYNPWVLVNNENTGNKKNSITSSNRTSTDFYPSIKAVVDYLAANYENLSNKLTSQTDIDSDSTDTEYPTAKAVYNYGSQISSAVEDVKAYIGYTDGDILGLHADFENKVFTRLGAAVGLTAGQDFNAFPMYGQRRRVVVESDGTITQLSAEHTTSGDICYDIMVYQPKFYYKVVPLKLEKQSSGLGYHIRKANYYISSTPHTGFKLHPLFFDKNGNEIEYVLFSAYEASYLYPTEGGFDYFHDGAGSDTGTSLDLEYGVLKSMPNVKPISGQYKAFNKTNAEILAQNKSSNWHLDTIQSVSANQLLMAIEYGTFNTQNAIGMGIVNNSDSGSNNCSSLTGSTSAETFNAASGMASETIYDVAGIEIPFNTSGKLAVSYRGMENPWGNIWKQINGINVWGNGSMGGGQAYIADNFNFNEEVKGETTINNVHYKYSSAGFSLANATGWISAFGYGKEEYDWLFLPSETTGNSSVPVSDNYYGIPNLNNSYRVLRYGGRWSDGYLTGGFCCSCGSPTGGYNSDAGGRLLFVPTATV